MKPEFSRHIFEKYWHIKFHENPSSESRLLTFLGCVFIYCGLFNDAVSSVEVVGLLVNNKFEGMWNGAAVAKFETISHNLCEGTA
jgi:hypothetical protein